MPSNNSIPMSQFLIIRGETGPDGRYDHIFQQAKHFTADWEVAVDKLIIERDSLSNVLHNEYLTISNEDNTLVLEDSLLNDGDDLAAAIQNVSSKNATKIIDLDFSADNVLFCKFIKKKTIFSLPIAKSLNLISKTGNPNIFLKGVSITKQNNGIGDYVVAYVKQPNTVVELTVKRKTDIWPYISKNSFRTIILTSDVLNKEKMGYETVDLLHIFNYSNSKDTFLEFEPPIKQFKRISSKIINRWPLVFQRDNGTPFYELKFTLV